MKVSKRLHDAAKLSAVPLYRVGQSVGIPGYRIYKLVCGIDDVSSAISPQVIALGAALGVPPEECFEDGEVGL
jgi:hypothetical protein